MTGQQLKNSILQMAVQGKLVPQDPNDEPASVLLERIRAEKEQLIKEKKIKKEKNPSVIFRGADNLPYEKVGNNEPVCIADEVPFEIPENWEWVRLIEICEYIQRGKSPKYSPIKKYPVIAQKCNQWSGFSIEKARFIEPDSLSSYGPERILQDFDLMWNSTGLGTLGRIAIYKAEANPYELAVADSHVTVIRPLKQFVLPEYLYYYFANPTVQSVIEDQSDGTTKQKELATATVKAYLVPLPPLNEQQRILSKLTEVLPVIQKYDSVYSESATMQAAFPERLKKSILQQAVQGKLVPQDSTDEPAEILLARIREEKARLVKEGKIKKAKHESVIFRRDNSHYEKLDGVERCIDDELPFEVPEKWVWARLSMVGITQTGNTPSTAHPEYRGNDTPFITPGDLLNGIISYENQGLSKKGTDVARICAKESILQVCIGGSIGKAAITNRQVAFNQQINAITPFLDSAYTLAVLSSFWFLSEMKSQAGGTATPILNRGLWDRMLIPVPPYSEQKRIAAKIEELLPLLNGL